MAGHARETAALHALGVLDPEEDSAAWARLSDAGFRHEFDGFRDTGEALASLVPPKPAPPKLRAKLLEPTAPLPNGLAALVETRKMSWKLSPFPGVSANRLFQDPQGNTSWLVKLDPGAVYPRRRHTTMEHCFVLEGEAQFDEYVLREGDYEVARANTDHSAFHQCRRRSVVHHRQQTRRSLLGLPAQRSRTKRRNRVPERLWAVRPCAGF